MPKQVWTHEGLMAMLYVTGWRPLDEPRLVTEGRPEGVTMFHETIAKVDGGMEMATKLVVDSREGKENVLSGKTYTITGFSKCVGKYQTFQYNAAGRRALYKYVMEG